ncbi:MAG: EAL domain-containing protein [Salaquimonas sp.]
MNNSSNRFIDGSPLPLEVYSNVVKSLHGDTRTLIFGKIATASAALVACYLGNNIYINIVACFLIIIAVFRFLHVAKFNSRHVEELNHANLLAVEKQYRALSGLYVTSMGLLCFACLGTSDDAMLHLIVISATLANVAGISGRNFASRRVVKYQTIGVTIPMIAGLLLFGDIYHTFLACLLLPFLVAIQSISHRLREMLFDASLQALDNKTIADRFEVALENASHGMAMVDNNGKFMVANERFGELFDCPNDIELIGSSLTDVTIRSISQRPGGFIGDAIPERVRICLQEQKKKRFTHQRLDGSTIEVSFNPMKDGAGVIVLEDITDRVKSEGEIKQLANYDTLTRLPNRRYFTSLIKSNITNDPQYSEFAVFFADLDNFKTVNDSLGHAVGDKLLCAVSLRMKSCLPEGGVICRFGGDEFVILLPGVDTKFECERFAKRIIEEVSKPVLIDGHLIIVGGSVGIALSPENGIDFDQLLKMADVALYEAKSKGRGALTFYSNELGDRIRERRKLEVDLRRAVQRGELSVHYQPLIDMKSNSVAACEALVRWKHPKLGNIPPSDFIPMAEEIGIISKIGKFVLEEAALECKKWPDNVNVAVNVSSLQFQQSDVCGMIETALLSSGLPASRLEIEVTESAVLEDMMETSRVLRTLAQSGVRISLDDFGTGFSSLSYLHQLPLDKVKIDRSFLESIRDDKRALILLAGVTNLAADIGLQVIVEGVEETEQLEILMREVHLDQVQGYLFGKAMPANEIRDFIVAFGSSDTKGSMVKTA